MRITTRKYYNFEYIAGHGSEPSYLSFTRYKNKNTYNYYFDTAPNEFRCFTIEDVDYDPKIDNDTIFDYCPTGRLTYVINRGIHLCLNANLRQENNYLLDYEEPSYGDKLHVNFEETSLREFLTNVAFVYDIKLKETVSRCDQLRHMLNSSYMKFHA